MATSESLRSIGAMPGRVASLERSVEELRARVADLEGSLAAVESVRDDVRRLTERVTEELNRLSAGDA